MNCKKFVPMTRIPGLEDRCRNCEKLRSEHHLIVVEVAYHRNGVSGTGFFVTLFDWSDEGKIRRMVATLFPDENGNHFVVNGNCAVLEVGQLVENNIAFANGNSWRADHFETTLRAAIKAYREGF